MDDFECSCVVGIDFGATGTTVAYSTAPLWRQPKFIEEWPAHPGNKAATLTHKLLTQVGYDDNRIIVPLSALNDSRDVVAVLEKTFKPYIDPRSLRGLPFKVFAFEAIRCYEEFMSALCVYVDSVLKQKVPFWQDMNVEYLFSLPAAWKNPIIGSNLEKLLERAGFANGINRRAKIYFTEAESVAVTAAKEYPQTCKVGCSVMVVDAGGAMTDVNCFEITERSANIVKLKPLMKSEGFNIGSLSTDARVRHMIGERLQDRGVKGSVEILHPVIDEMMQEAQFEMIKCNLYDHGSVSMHRFVDFVMPARLAPYVSDRHVTVGKGELRQIFDLEVTELEAQIELQILNLARLYPSRTLDFMFLYGGLGSSSQVLNRLRSRFRNIKVLSTHEPHLAVAKGLVLDRVQVLKGLGRIYTETLSMVSYGLLGRQEYDSVKHRGEVFELDPQTKRVYATDQIDWFIKEGQSCRDTVLSRSYRVKISQDKMVEKIETQIVISEAPDRHLPTNNRNSVVEQLCKLMVTIKGNKRFKLKRDSPWSRRLNFEILSMDGEKYNKDIVSIDIEWQGQTAADFAAAKAQYREDSKARASTARVKEDPVWEDPTEFETGPESVAKSLNSPIPDSITDAAPDYIMHVASATSLLPSPAFDTINVFPNITSTVAGMQLEPPNNLLSDLTKSLLNSFDHTEKAVKLTKAMWIQETDKHKCRRLSERFRLWIQDLDVLSSGDTSLDRRLRDAELVRQHISLVLTQIIDHLREVRNILDGTRLPFEAQSQLVKSRTSDAEAEVSKTRYSKADSKNSSDSEPESDSSVSEVTFRLDSITEKLDGLSALAFGIRNPDDRPARTTSGFKNWEKIETEFATWIWREFATQVWQQGNSSPTTSGQDQQLKVSTFIDNLCRRQAWLIARVGKANVRRFQNLLDWKMHSPASIAPGEQQPPPYTYFEGTAQDRSAIQSGAAEPESPSSVSIDRLSYSLDFDFEDNASSAGSASSFRFGEGEHIVWPDPPSDVAVGEGFICSFCKLSCPKSYCKQKPWRAHVLRDLQAYCCTYQDCLNPDRLYETRAEWIAHEASNHRRVWVCQQHPDDEYETRDEYVTHLEQYHPEEPELRLDRLVNAAAQPSLAPRICCFCAITYESSEIDKHVADHLEMFALLVLQEGRGIIGSNASDD